MDHPRLAWLGLGALAAMVVVGVVHRALTGLRGASRRARQRKAQRGEVDAERLLRSLGYRVVGRQVRQSFEVAVDGATLEVQLRADYLVQRGGEALVAEVKTGKAAPQLETAATRRQLLEYAIGFGTAAVLLVDMEQGLVKEVRFPRAPEAGRARGLAWFALGTAAGALMAAALPW